MGRQLLAASWLVCAACVSACVERWSDYKPCTEDDPFIYADVVYDDGRYIDPDGFPYAKAGERPFEGCTEILGRIVLRGTLNDFSDFDEIEAIMGFVDDGASLPAIEGTACGGVGGFPSLKYITFIWQEDGEGSQYPCLFLDGFESLQFVEGDFVCSQASANVPTQLIVVTGHLLCENGPLVSLERVGKLVLDGAPLPKLRIARELFSLESLEYATYDYPSLEEVNGDFRIGGKTTRGIDLSSLLKVDGTLFLIGVFYSVDVPVPAAEKAAYVRSLFDHVETTGYRAICRNTDNDPCPDDANCEAVYGAGSLECCKEVWPVCQGVQE